MQPTPEEFKATATGGVLYGPFGGLYLIVQAGMEPNGAFWVLCPGYDFHMLATLGLTFERVGPQLVWSDPTGTAIFVVAPLASCEELNRGDAEHTIATAAEEYATPAGQAFVQQQLAGVKASGPLQMTWGK